MERNFWGELIRLLREEKGLSLRALAREIGMNRTTLRKMELGEARCDSHTLERLLGFLGYEVEAIQKIYSDEELGHSAIEAIDSARRSRLAAVKILTLNLN